MKSFYLIIVYIAAVLSTAQASTKTGGPSTLGISLQAVDRNGNPLQTLVAGEYIRLDLKADLSRLPQKASASVTASAAFTTTILGRTVGYSLSLPLKGNAGSRIDPSVGGPLSGTDLAKPYENTIYREILDFQIPPEAPAGVVTFTVTVTATSMKTIKRKFVFPIRR
jgi:hypothetical protein